MRQGLILLASPALCLALAAWGASPQLLFQYELGGGPPASTRYIIRLLGNGSFSAFTEGLPFTNTGLTKHKFATTLSPTEAVQLAKLAMESSDFEPSHRESWPDCKWAVLEVMYQYKVVTRHSGCLGSSNERTHTQAFISKMWSYLPQNMRELP